jgi:hypothetical protein
MRRRSGAALYGAVIVTLPVPPARDRLLEAALDAVGEERLERPALLAEDTVGLLVAVGLLRELVDVMVLSHRHLVLLIRRWRTSSSFGPFGALFGVKVLSREHEGHRLDWHHLVEGLLSASGIGVEREGQVGAGNGGLQIREQSSRGASRGAQISRRVRVSQLVRSWRPW